ncbi:TRAP transporter substrate-binding protein DctP [Belnapia sp. T6]|uniref:TRAP transporter substrate-binding protein DctP n=1 Tax=Belnapia mucosa TaxID=2804532 RepID=A0ABS1VBD1_9PROT|nr:TRAP transporter substrate-binding protein DctP [Belnapia mucosa]MBL6458985.1 TRAP transporter substrate-binding protein DctP [Belnapia mucosa]
MALRQSVAVALSLALAAPAVADERLRFDVISGFLGPWQFRTLEQPFWLQEVPALTGGRAAAALRAGSSLGVTSEQMLTVMRNGVATFGTLELRALTLIEPEWGVADLPLLANDEVSLHRAIDLWRPRIAAQMQESYGIELLAVFIRAPQVMFCNRPFASLLDLAGRKVRVASVNQSDLIVALGAIPVVLELERVVNSIRAGALDCAVTGAMPASVTGLTRVTSHASTVPLGWSMAFFTANGARWAALPEAVRAPLREGIQRMEGAMWRAAEAQRAEGEACLTGQTVGCTVEPSRIQHVGESAAGRAALRALFASAVLPGWVRRCGAACAESWNAVAAPVLGVFARR